MHVALFSDFLFSLLTPQIPLQHHGCTQALILCLTNFFDMYLHSILSCFLGILEYATLLALKKYGNFELSRMAKMKLRRGGSVHTSKVLEVKNGNLESDQTQGNFKDFSKIIEKLAFSGCSIYISIFVIM